MSFFEALTESFRPEGALLSNENDSNVLLDNMLRTMEFEGGHEDKAYLDSLGYPTIGAGHLLEKKKYDVLPEKYKDLTWSEEKSQETFFDDYLNKKQDVARRYGEEDFESLPQEVQGILTDLAFNLGAEGLFGGAGKKGFPGFLEDIKGKRYGEAAKELRYKNPDKGNFEMSDWWNQVGGDTTESRDEVRSGNRATATFDLLTSLMNQ